MGPTETDVGRALRVLARWWLIGVLLVLCLVALGLALFVALASVAYLRGPVPTPTHPPLLP